MNVHECLGVSILSYTGDPDQKALIQGVMRELHDKRRASDAEVIKAIERWAKFDPEEWPSFTYKTYERYRKSGVLNFDKGALLYAFFSRGPDRFRLISSSLSGRRAATESQRFVDIFMDNFSSSDGGYRYNQIECMRYTYALYRRSWLLGGEGHFVRSIMRIDKEEGVYRVTEIQKFDFRGEPVDQVDWGWIFPYGTNFFAILNSPACMKFCDFHDLRPTPYENGSVNNMIGNMIAVSGKGPHPSFRVWARRVKLEAVIMGCFKVDDYVDDEELSVILDYIMN